MTDKPIDYFNIILNGMITSLPIFNVSCAGSNTGQTAAQWIYTPYPGPYPDEPQEDLDIEQPTHKPVSNGCKCRHCEDFLPYAEPDRQDGTTICYRCKNNL